MLEIYKLLNEIISLIKENWPEVALKLYLVSASQVNSILSEKKKVFFQKKRTSKKLVLLS